MMAAHARSLIDDRTAAQAEATRLGRQVESLLETHRKLATLLVAADTRAGDLLKVLVSVRALIESRDAAGALESVRDILVNVVGAAEFVIYAMEPRTRMLAPIAVVGGKGQDVPPIPLDSGWIGETVRSGALVIDREPLVRGSRTPSVAALVPLRVLEGVVGAIIVTRLLPHRDVLGACDREVLALLGVYAATAIIAADRRDRWRELPEVLL